MFFASCRFRYVLSVTLLIFAAFTHANVIIGGTRVIVTDSPNGTSLQLSNPENSGVFLVQSYITPYKKADKAEAHKVHNKGHKAEAHKADQQIVIPFIVTPPLFRIDPGQQNVVRIVYTGGLPTDRESVFAYHAKVIPQLKKNSGNLLALAMESTLKLFYRPAALTGKTATDAYKKLTFSRQKDRLLVSNPTPYYISLHEIKVEEEKVNIKQDPAHSMLTPFGSASYSIRSKTGNSVTWKTIDDLGNLTKEEQASL